MNKTNYNSGFTIVETLVAIAILMIAISGPLSISSKSLTAALYAKDQMIASYLAQETIEYVTNLRDNNIGVDPVKPYLDQLDTCVGKGNDACDASAMNGVTNICRTGGCPLYLKDDGTYDHTSGGQATIFKRYFYIEIMNPDPDHGNPDGTEARITTVVTWNEGTVQNSTTLTSQLVDLENVI
jgi:type II secretory pathway pseudopilin PulG